MFHKTRYILLTLLIAAQIQAQTELPEGFQAAEPKMQLYMAYAEFKMAHYETAREMWLHITGKGSGEAAFNLGVLYEQGMGVEQDLTKARDYYLLAVEKGSRAGAYQVGLMHLNHPELVSAETATHWLTIAALDGDEDAVEMLKSINLGTARAGPMLEVRQLIARGEVDPARDLLVELAGATPPDYEAVTRLAWLYETGLGVEQDIARAGELFTVAAEGGSAEAQYALSIMYETGVGRPKDSAQSAYWLELSAQQGYQPAVDKMKLKYELVP
ncbi:MAG: tetratricopeptide repeat protein [Porticoccaceae bacterium]